MNSCALNFEGQTFQFHYKRTVIEGLIRYTVYIEDPKLLAKGDPIYVFLRKPHVSVGSGFIAETRFLFKNIKLRLCIQHVLENLQEESESFEKNETS